MPRLAANLSMMFTEVPFLDRFERARACGFEAVEFLFPYDHEPREIKDRLDGNRLQLVLHNLPPGDWAKGERGIACHPGRDAEFKAALEKGIRYATALGTPQVHCMSGLRPDGVSDEAMRATLVANLRHAAAETKKAGLKLLLEPINPIDIPGYYLNSSGQALSLIDEVGADNVFLQYDIYHAQRVEGELAATMQKHLPRIAHMQLADNPGRNEPGTGEINYAFLFRFLDRIGYDGWIGCEYKPADGTEAGLGWRERLMPST